MNVNDMVAAMAAKTVDAMVNVEPYNAIAEADGLAILISDFYDFDKLPVFMAATPEFVDKSRIPWWPTSRPGSKSPRTSSPTQARSPTRSIRSTPQRATPWHRTPSPRRLRGLRSIPAGLPTYVPYMTHHCEVLVKANKIKAIPDWNKAFRTDFLKKAMA